MRPKLRLAAGRVKRIAVVAISTFLAAGCAAGGGSSTNGNHSGKKSVGGETSPTTGPADGICDLPLANGQSWCAVAKYQDMRRLKILTFHTDCTMSFSAFTIDDHGQATTQVDQFVGTWVLSKKRLKMQTTKGDLQAEIEVSADGQTMTSAEQTLETYIICSVN